MLVLTVVSQFSVLPKMTALRSAMGDVDSVADKDPVRLEFNTLHAWSTRLEGGTLLLGLIVVYLTARQPA